MTAIDFHPEELIDLARHGLLSLRDRERLDLHLDGCAACAFEVRAGRDFDAQFAEPMPMQAHQISALVDSVLTSLHGPLALGVTASLARGEIGEAARAAQPLPRQSALPKATPPPLPRAIASLRPPPAIPSDSAIGGHATPRPMARPPVPGPEILAGVAATPGSAGLVELPIDPDLFAPRVFGVALRGARLGIVLATATLAIAAVVGAMVVSSKPGPFDGVAASSGSDASSPSAERPWGGRDPGEDGDLRGERARPAGLPPGTAVDGASADDDAVGPQPAAGEDSLAGTGGVEDRSANEPADDEAADDPNRIADDDTALEEADRDMVDDAGGDAVGDAARPPSAAELLARANRARQLGQHGRAVRTYRRLQRRYPRSREAVVSRVSLGRVLLDYQRDARGALANFERYLRGAGDGVLAEEARLGRAVALERLGRRTSAREAWQDLLTRHPRSPQAARARRHLARLL